MKELDNIEQDKNPFSQKNESVPQEIVHDSWYKNINSKPYDKKKKKRNYIWWLVCWAIVIWTFVDVDGGGYTTYYKPNVLECKGTDYPSLCVEDTLLHLKDDWVKSCVETNIDSKPQLAEYLKNGKLAAQEVDDIDALVKECSFYKSQNSVSDSHPVFNSFVAAAAWSFVGNYLADAFFSNLKDYSYVQKKTPLNNSNNSINNYGTTSSDNYKWSSSSTYKSSSSKSDWLQQVENQYKSSTWNIKEMKSASASTSNYKLWDTGKTWSSTSSRSSSSKSWSSSSSSKSSSSSSKSSGW